MKKLFSIAMAVVCTLGIVFMSAYAMRPYDDRITTAALEAETQTCDYILAQVNDSPSPKPAVFSYYEISGDTDFSELFAFGNWSISKNVPQGTPAVVLHFAEAWNLELYSDGTAWAWNGYASLGTKSDCYYTFSAVMLDSIIAYMKEYAIPHTLGDGVISIGTFHHQTVHDGICR